ncbi:isocitrate dehydrogenase [Rufibacter quisquiliarum]|uniref:Isocitrate dehydrogenase [NADP] n=2 Tax=Rufibacter quisquiliarum TaxID=1549639 RepID=A0A839GMG9_9BACT|nr:isocitrate dehydrogenase [Rufibacter quisquiliarum]
METKDVTEILAAPAAPVMPRITVAHGDGIGPEIMDATLKILFTAGAQLEIEEVALGEHEYLAGNSSGIPQKSWDSIKENRVMLKAPITTPQGGGYKSLNVTLRKTLGLYANVRPVRSLHPYVQTKHPVMDMVIIRENEEDVYGSIEHQQTDEVVQCLKLITRPGCEKIVRYAFEYARQHNRKKVTCFTKDNIMKQTDGLFHEVFREVAQEYPELEAQHLIVDIGAALLADSPEKFDVVVLPNLYGDILSDVAAQISGSVGLAGSANIGQNYAIFEAIHGSAPDIAGQDVANPSGLLQAAIMMLAHLGQARVAQKVQNAWLKTLEDGTHTRDIYREGVSRQLVGTEDFALAVISNLGKAPAHLPPAATFKNRPIQVPPYQRAAAAHKELLGVDVFVHWRGTDPEELAQLVQPLAKQELELRMITNRGVKVWPQGFDETFCTDHWRCRFQSRTGAALAPLQVVELLQEAVHRGIDTIKTENLYAFNGKPGFSMGQGQ